MKPTLLVALAALCLLAADPQDAQNKQDKARQEAREKRNFQRWQGTFEAVSIINDGDIVPAEELKKRKLTIKGNEYHFRSGDFSEHGTYKWYVMKDPKEVDIQVGDGKDKGKVYLACFDANDMGVKIWFEKENKKRPAVPVALKGTGITLELWKKVKP